MNINNVFCCSEYENLCLTAKNCADTINLGIIAPADGDYKIYTILGGVLPTEQTLDLLLGEPIEITIPYRGRVGTVVVAIFDPMGNNLGCYTFDLAKITTVEPAAEPVTPPFEVEAVTEVAEPYCAVLDEFNCCLDANECTNLTSVLNCNTCE